MYSEKAFGQQAVKNLPCAVFFVAIVLKFEVSGVVGASLLVRFCYIREQARSYCSAFGFSKRDLK